MRNYMLLFPSLYKMRRLSSIICVIFVSVSSVESIENPAGTGVKVYTKHRSHQQDVGRTRSSLHNINRGGGMKGRKASPPPQPPSASPKLLQSMRLLYLTYYASLGALMPYLPVYFHSLGHPGSSIGLLGAVKPLTTFLVAVRCCMYILFAYDAY